MKVIITKLFAIALLFLTANASADDDRFGSERYEVNRVSFSESTPNRDVLISSAPVQWSSATYQSPQGELYLKGLDCYGIETTTVTFYDTITFNADVTTRTKYIHVGMEAPTGIVGHTEARYNMLFSSGLMWSKQGAAPCTLLYDFTTPPRGRLRHY